MLLLQYMDKLDELLQNAAEMIQVIGANIPEKKITSITASHPLSYNDICNTGDYVEEDVRTLDYELRGQVDLLINNKYPVEIKLCTITQEKYKQQAAMYSVLAMYDEDVAITDKHIKSFLCNVNMGDIYEFPLYWDASGHKLLVENMLIDQLLTQ